MKSKLADSPIIEYSIVFPVYNEQENVKPLVERINKTMLNVGRKFEIIIVENGSYDSTPSILNTLLQEKNSIIVLTLTRNFGYESAIAIGLEYARGNWIIILDGDQQDPPEIIPEFIKKANEGFSIVYGIRNVRTENFLIRWQIKLFYKIWKNISDFDMPQNAGNFGIMSQEVVKTINSMTERNKFIRGLRAWTGYKSTGLTYQREKRKFGSSKFSFTKYFNHALNGITSFSTVPLRMLTYIGGIGFLLCLLIGTILLITKISQISGFYILPYTIASGTTTLALLILSAISINLLGLGILGEYLGRILEEVKNRPNVLVKKVCYSKDFFL